MPFLQPNNYVNIDISSSTNLRFLCSLFGFWKTILTGLTTSNGDTFIAFTTNKRDKTLEFALILTFTFNLCVLVAYFDYQFLVKTEISLP